MDISLIQGTTIVLLGAVPGAISLHLALAPRARAIKGSSLSSRVFWLAFFSILNWGIAVRLFNWLGPRADVGAAVAVLLSGEPKDRLAVLSCVLSMQPKVICFASFLALSSCLSGGAVAGLYNLALSSIAIVEHPGLGFNLSTRNQNARKRNRISCLRYWWRFGRLFVLGCVAQFLRRFGMTEFLQPKGAAHWIIIQRAADLSAKFSAAAPFDAALRSMFVDVLQGDQDMGDGKVGTLYRGSVKHLLCDVDGNISAVLLRDAQRWQLAWSSEHRVLNAEGERTKVWKKGGWKPVESSAGLLIAGTEIRNISFRTYSAFEEFSVQLPLLKENEVKVETNQ